MINIDDKTRRLSQATIVIGYKQENKAESIEFEIPDYLKEYGKKICFKTKDGKVFSKLFDNTTSNIFTFTRTETQYGELDATIEFFKTENEDMVIYKTSMLHIIFNESIICEDEVQPDEPKIPILESLIEKVTELNNTITENEKTRNNNENTRISNENERKTNEKERETYYTNIQNKVNNGEFNGATYLPNVDAEGNISWTNNKGLENPSLQNIRGPQGIQGAQGEPFKIKKTYSSIEEMQADFDNMEVGDYAMIANSVEIEDNAKLYYRTETEWVFITDFSGATGIQGPQGPQGIQGIQGERGIGISRLEVKDGYLYVTLTDNTQQNAGLIITDEVKQWIVNQVTENAKSKFNTYYDGKVTDFDNHVTVKTNEFNTNATNKVNEYNQNAESLINRVAECKTENERLRNDIKSIALPGEASGENIHIEDSSDARCEIEIDGNQKQDTREGYNLLIPPASKTENGITFTTNEDGSVTANGTATADASINFLNKEGSHSFSFEAGTYKLTGCPKGGSKTTYRLGMNIANTTFDIGEGVTSTINADVTGKAIWLAISAGVTVNNLTFYPMLIKGTENKPFEQYGASPSVDYPSEIQTVGSIKNILDMSNAKGGTSGGITCTMNKEGSYTYKGTASSKTINIWLLGSYSNKTSIFRLEPGTYYIDGVVLSDGNNALANPDTAKIFTFINAHDITGVRALDAVLGNTYDETKYPIIARIDHEIPWIPYEMGYIKVNEFNKNYLSKIPKTSVTAQGITSTFDGEKFICKGTAQTNYFNLFTEKVYKKISKGIKTFSTNKLKKGRAFIHFDYVDGTGQNYYTSINTNQVRFTLNKDVESYRLNVDSITAGDTIDDNIYVQLEDGKIATEIEKAENQEYLVDVQQEMLDGDTFVRQDGKWYEKHNWITLLNENIVNNIDGIKDESKKTITTSINLTETPAERSAISNILTYTNNWNDTEHMIFSASLNTIYCLYNKDRFSELNYETIKKEIGELGGIIKYKSNKSTYLECTEAQSKVLDEIYNKAHTYKNITNISAESSEVNPIVNVKYLKDTEKYIEDKITNALTEINANN